MSSALLRRSHVLLRVPAGRGYRCFCPMPHPVRRAAAPTPLDAIVWYASVASPQCRPFHTGGLDKGVGRRPSASHTRFFKKDHSRHPPRQESPHHGAGEREHEDGELDVEVLPEMEEVESEEREIPSPSSPSRSRSSSSSSVAGFLAIRRGASEESDLVRRREFRPFEDDDDDDTDKTGMMTRRRRRRGQLPLETKVKICEEIERIMQRELRAEVARDARDGVAAIPPLSPPGWRVDHTPSMRCFTMTRTLEPGSDGGRGGRVFRSVLEEALSKHRNERAVASAAKRADKNQKTERNPPSLSSRWDQRAVRSSGSTASEGGEEEERLAARQTPTAVPTRFRTHLFLYAPFRVQDLSLLDSKVPITEHACFDLYVHKQPADDVSPSALLPAQQRLWDDRVCLCLRLASVNSELRLRGVQFFSRPLERRLLETAAFGRGDPLCVAASNQSREQRHRELQHQRQRLRRGQGQGSDAMTAGSPMYAAPPSSSFGLGDDLLLLEQTSFGEFCRGACYHGPHLSELSRELHDALLEYVMAHLGITSVVTEYVCQMQYFLEQEEYMAWLARLGMAASSLKSHIKNA